MTAPSPADSSSRDIDRANAKYFDQAGGRVSGLDLTELGLDAHAVANLLWRISAYYARRAGMSS